MHAPPQTMRKCDVRENAGSEHGKRSPGFSPLQGERSAQAGAFIPNTGVTSSARLLTGLTAPGPWQAAAAQ